MILTSPFSPDSGHKNPHVKGAFPVPGGKEHPYLQRCRGTGRDPNEHTLLSFPPFSHLAHTLLSYQISLTFHSSANLVSKYSRLTISSGLHYLMKAVCHIKVNIKSIHIYSFLLLIGFLYRDPAENLRWIEERYFSSSAYAFSFEKS